MKALFSMAVLLISFVSVCAQDPASRVRQRVYLRKGQLSVYLTLERVGQLKSPESADDKDRVWLRFHNNTRWPIRLDMGGVPSAEYGDAELFFDGLLDGKLVFRNLCHSCTTNMLGSGRSLIFSVPRVDLGEGRAIRVKFSYGWEDWDDVTAGREPEHYVYFFASKLPQPSPAKAANTSSDKRALPCFSPKNPVDCEVANFYADDVIRRWQENDNGSYLIIIARLGNGETSRQLNRARLKAIRTYLKRYPNTKLITAEGERVNGYGCLEFYLNGKRLYIIPISKHATIDLFSCNGV
jgi:hypothetical protein